MTDPDRRFGWLTADIARLLRTVFDRRVKRLGITRPQWLAIVRLSRRPGASQSELADMMEIERAPAGKIVDRLEERGWIERRPDPDDRRINRIFLTDRGDQVHALISPIAEATVSDSLVDLDDAQIEQLTELLIRVKTRLAELAETDTSTELDLPEMFEERDLSDAQSV